MLARDMMESEGHTVKSIAIVIFDSFTDIDLFLMWDILGRNKKDRQVRILGTKSEHVSAHDLAVRTQGHVAEANEADVVQASERASMPPNPLPHPTGHGWLRYPPPAGEPKR